MDALGKLVSTLKARVRLIHCLVWLLLFSHYASLMFSNLLHASITQWKHPNHEPISIIIIQCIFLVLFIGQELTTWPVNNCLQISFLLQIVFCSCVIETSLLCENGRSVPWAVWSVLKVPLWSNSQGNLMAAVNSQK